MVCEKKEKNMSPMNYRDFKDLSLCIRENMHKLPKCDLIVGIPRSGMIPAYMIGIFLNKKVCSLDEFLVGILPSSGYTRIIDSPKIKNVLVVDDTINSGLSLEKTKEMIANAGLDKKYRLKYIAIYAKNESKEKVDLFFETVPFPRLFQWNYLNVKGNERMCFDIDGVLCVNPTEKENDEEEEYKNFLLNAKPLYIPKNNVYAIVTSRREKYRSETEEWLRKNGVKYDFLFMLDLPSKRERIKLDVHAKFKAEIYSKLTDSFLFVASEDKQAREISEISGKPCVCVVTDALYAGNYVARTQIIERDEIIERATSKGIAIAFHRFGELAEGGDVTAMRKLSYMHRDGKGTAKDIDKAIEWLRRSAELGDDRIKDEFVGALLKRASLEDFREAHDICVLLAEKDNRNAMFRLGRMYRDGKGTAKDIDKAIEWMRRSAELGNDLAKSELADLLNGRSKKK